MSPTQPSDDQRRRDVRRVERQRARLQALLDTDRTRVTALRVARGALGFAASFAAMVKFKLAASLGAKVALAAIVAIGFAWPLAALAVGLVALFVLSLFDDGPHSVPDFCYDCDCRRARRERLKRLLSARETWLAGPTWPAPAIRATPRAGR